MLKLNPLYAYIQAFGWAMLGRPFPEIEFLAYSLGLTAFVLVTGTIIFIRNEWQFAEIV